MIFNININYQICSIILMKLKRMWCLINMLNKFINHSINQLEESKLNIYIQGLNLQLELNTNNFVKPSNSNR
ncbi:unnamed protein product [Paramecium primaurelia]|uniref:Uncharacterized protein n=1 Tax=Paramecium primaurelia TaxID=5886 RepID=A0A8S1QPM2_PARPR|nr:unnamed protein product [Paramecium primaurelia]